MKKKRILILVGAGSSIEYNTPSTYGLTDIIERLVTGDDLAKAVRADDAYKEIKEILSAYLSAAPQFEQIFHCAHELSFSGGPTPGAVDRYKPIMHSFFDKKLSFSEESYRVLCDKIIEIIFKEIVRSCKNNAVSLRPLEKFINWIRSEYTSRIYTTNYDDFLLQASPDLYVGYDTNSDSAARFDVDGFWKKEGSDCLFYLHGSVHFGFPVPPGSGDLGEIFWYRDRDEALKNMSFGGSTSVDRRMDGTSTARTPIVTGLQKLSTLQMRPLAHYYSAFARDAMNADLIFVIGAGLADLHLNTWLAEARCRNPTPPLIFVDFWKNGFEADTYYEHDSKSIDLFHRLRVYATDRYRGERHADWIISNDKTAAIWDKGFQSFLNGSSLPGIIDLLFAEVGKGKLTPT